MKVTGDLRPEVSFSIESIPRKAGYFLVRFYENAKEYSYQVEGTTYSGWEYDEYHLEMKDTGSVQEDIQNNFDIYLEQAKLLDKEYQESQSSGTGGSSAPSEEISALKDEINKIKEENASIKSINEQIQQVNTEIQEENSLIKQENAQIKLDNESIKEENKQLKETTETLSSKIENSSQMNDQIQIATMFYVQTATTIPDVAALKMPDLFITWEDALASGSSLEYGIILNDGGQLYRVVQSGGVTPQSHQAPHNAGMLAVYRPIELGHTGTQEDPIPYTDGMDTEKDKYYTYNNKLYLCNLAMTPCVWPPDTSGLWQWTLIE